MCYQTICFAFPTFVRTPQNRLSLPEEGGNTNVSFNKYIYRKQAPFAPYSTEARQQAVPDDRKTPRRITLFDSTLRDGLLHPRLKHLSVNKRLSIADALVQTPLDVMEVGHCKRKWPSSYNMNEDEEILVELARHFRHIHRSQTYKPPILCALTDTKPDHIEAALISIEEAPFTRVNIYARVSTEQNPFLPMSSEKLRNLQQTVTRAVSLAAKSVGKNGDVQFTLADATHAHERTISVITETAIAAGATTVVLADTAGIADPTRIVSLVAIAKSVATDHVIGLHAHNDKRQAVTNSVAALLFGASHIEGTFLGIGPRRGNTQLDSVAKWLERSQSCNIGCVDSTYRFEQAANAITHILRHELGNPFGAHTIPKISKSHDPDIERIVDSILNGEG